MKEEDEILRKCGTGNPFTVPDGYFDHFKDHIMEQLPEKVEKPFIKHHITRWSRVKPWFYMTAVFTGMLLGVRLMLNLTSGNESSETSKHAETEIVTDRYVETMIDHSMMDDYSLYESLTEAE